MDIKAVRPDLTERLKPYLVEADPGDEKDVRERLAPGLRVVDGQIMYSADWLDDHRPRWIDENGAEHVL